MMKYRKKPQDVEAIKWEDGNLEDIIEFFGKLEEQEGMSLGNDSFKYYGNRLFVFTPEGVTPVAEGNYVVRNARSEYAVMHQNNFEKNYEVIR